MLMRYGTLAIAAALALGACSRKEAPKDTAVAVDTTTPPPAPDPFIVAGGRRLTFMLDSIPAEAMAAVKARYPNFTVYQPGDYPESARSGYRASPGDGMSVIRGNFTGGSTGYVVAGRRGETQDVIFIVPETNGWMARSVVASGAPPFYPWVTLTRRARANANGRWDGVAVRVHDPGGAYDDVYAWDTREKRFNMGGGRR
jgi:hypothetical protein